FPQRRGPAGYEGPGAGLDVGAGDTKLQPSAAPEEVVAVDGLEAIDGPGESRLGRLSGLKLVPERPELLRLVGGQEPKKALGCQLLPLVLLGAVVVVVEVVARVDLDNVVNEQHLDHASYVEGRGRGKLSQHHGHDGQVPRVLGGVFAARSVQQPVAAGDGLELVDFPEEMQLTFKT